MSYDSPFYRPGDEPKSSRRNRTHYASALVNLATAITPGGIEASEKAGQMEQATLDTLPRKLGVFKPDLEKLGFVFGKNVDQLFVQVQFPNGWKKVPTSHDMWSDLVDDKGRKRGSIFYKAAFYDQEAFLRLTSRFSVRHVYESSEVRVFDEMNQVEFKISGLTAPDYKDRVLSAKQNDAIEEALVTAKAFLTTNYPDWESCTAHW